jgi:hypothetical protein
MVSPAGILRNAGTPADVLTRYERVLRDVRNQKDSESKRELLKLLPEISADPRTLWVEWDWLKSNGGDAPGPNGITYADLNHATIWGLLRDINGRLLDGTYRPGPVRRTSIPKTSESGGTRTLSIPNIEDRCIQRAVLQVASPWLDPMFDQDSFGGRPGRSTWMALARALSLVERGYTQLISQDIRDAFDNVPINRLLDALSQRIPSPSFVALVKEAVLGAAKKGLQQGSPLSPLLMNVYVDHFLDRPWHQRHPDVPLLRYIDDVLILCHVDHDPAALHDDLENLLTPAGMPLKHTPEKAIRNLHQEACIWLGYELSRGPNGPVVVRPAQWLDELRDSLMRAHRGENSPLLAQNAIRGVVQYAAPCFPFTVHRAVYQAVHEAAADMGFEEAVSDQPTFCRAWKCAYARWRELAKQHGYACRCPKRHGKVRAARRMSARSADDAPF